MDRNKPITFKDLKFEPHPVSMFFGGHAKIFIDKVGTVSIVGPYKNTYNIHPMDDKAGTYEIWAIDLWEEPITYLTIEELDKILLDLQRNPLDIKKGLNKFNFLK